MITSKKSPITWFAVLDSRRAQFYQRKPMHKEPDQSLSHNGRRLEPIFDTSLVAESIEDYEIGRHQLGRVFESANPPRHSPSSHTGISEEIKLRFIRKIVETLEKCHAAKAFDQLVLVAPAKIIGILRKSLSADIKKSIITEVVKDLTHHQSEALSGFLAAVA